MNRRIQMKQKRKSYAWNYLDASKLWNKKLLTETGLLRVTKMLRSSMLQTPMLLK